MSEAHERKAKRILSRDWAMLQTAWIDHVPQLSLPGSPPQELLSDLTELDSQLNRIPKDQVEEVFIPIPGLRQAVLHDGIFLLHKAAHVLGSALVHVTQGMCTWSLSSAYQAAFFGMRSVLNFLGVSVIQAKDQRHFLIDVWGLPQKPRKGVKGQITILANTGRNEQRHIWAYFQRAVSVTENLENVCSQKLLSLVRQSDFTDFGRQRNHLHYRPNMWVFDDIHVCMHQAGFGVTGDDAIDFNQRDISLILAYGLVRMARNMLSNLATLSHVASLEVNLIDAWLSQPFNQNYVQSAI